MAPLDRAAWLRLCLTPGVGPQTALALLRALGLPENVFDASESSLAGIVGQATARALVQSPQGLGDAVQALEVWLGRAPEHHHFVTLGDPRYPQAWLELPDPPVAFYVVGALPEQWPRALGVVGSRNATPQGLQTARQFSKNLAEAGWCVVSGLALGIDGAAHEGALLAESTGGAPLTVAVVGTGLDRVYPRGHHALAQRIAERGAIVSEYPLGTPALAHNFPRRNRLIAGLSRGVLVVEAAVQSGSLITARMALEYGREVFAIPGSIHSPQARGCHALIRQGAKLVETAQDILEELGSTSPAMAAIAPSADATPSRRHRARTQKPVDAGSDANAGASGAELEGDLGAALRAIGHDPVDLDTLVQRLGWALPRVQASLTELELEGRVARLAAGRLQRLG